MIKFGNAPCSWGTIEGIGEGVPYPRMLNELVESGYTGTELGDYGFMPTDPEALRAELLGRQLTMLGAYEGVYLRDPAKYNEGESRVLRVARLLQSVADIGDPTWQPMLVLADEHSRDHDRLHHAGRISSQHGLNAADWKNFTGGASRMATAVKNETGLEMVFHHHCGGYIETADEIAHFLELTDSSVINLVFDTGHFLYGSGGNDPQTVLGGLERFGERIRYLHFKDMSPQVATNARQAELTYPQAVGAGVFCELGKGAVPFPEVLAHTQQRGYTGWITVEQDVLPGMGEPLVSASANRAYLAGLEQQLGT